MRSLSKKRGFTLVELLVVISIIALLMALLIPALSKARKQTKTVVCQTQLKQWELCFHMYTEDNDYRYHIGYTKTSYYGDSDRKRTSHQWMEAFIPYYGNVDGIRCCPEAILKYDIAKVTPSSGIHKIKIRGKTFEPWYWKDTYSSYAINGFICNPDIAIGNKDEYYWRTPLVKKASQIPVLGDGIWSDSWPEHSDEPPPTDGDYVMVNTTLFCINRHNEHVNLLFADGSVRKIGLKQLWTLKWSRKYSTKGPWTRAGGVRMEDWPEWMKKLRAY